VYSEKGPGPNCFLNWAFKEGKQSSNQGNVALVQMYGTAAQPCAVGATISIKLNAYQASLQAYNSTGGISGSLCDIKLASIEWNFCPKVSTLTAVTLTYSAGTIQLKTTATAWSWTDPIAVDGGGQCHTGSSNTCNLSLTTSLSPDIIIVYQGCFSAGGCGVFTKASDTSSLSWTTRVCHGSDGQTCASVNGFDSVQEDYATSSGTLSGDSITCTQTGNTNGRISCVAFGISGAATSSFFDANGAVPCTGDNGGSTSTPFTCSISTSNANDMIIGGAANGLGSGAQTMTAGTGFTFAETTNGGSTDGDGSAVGEYDVVSSTQSGLSVAVTTSSAGTHWAIIGDAIKQAAGGASYTFTVSATLTANGAFTNAPTHKMAATVTLNGAFTNKPERTMSATLTANGAFQPKSVHNFVGVLAATGSFSCLLNGGSCGGLFFKFYMNGTLTLTGIFRCINYISCSPPISSAVEPNLDFLLLLPLGMVIFLVILVKRRK
jgi:hypothetical protein